MHAREIVELAALVSAHGPALAHGPHRIAPELLESYWTASKCRLDRWGRSLRWLADSATAPKSSRRIAAAAWARGLIEEILLADVLTRTWSAVLRAYDHEHGSEMADPVARSVLVGQMESRHRALQLLLDGGVLHSEDAFALDRLRRRAERWTDLLLAYLSELGEAIELAHDRELVREFAEELKASEGLEARRQGWPLIVASLQAAFRARFAGSSPNGDLNARIAAAVVACYPGELFDGSGVFRSLWVNRLLHAAHDTAGLLDELFQADETGLDCRDFIRGEDRGNLPGRPPFTG